MNRKKKLLAVSSGGGHWVQLLRLRPAFEGCDVTYATVRPGYQRDVENASFVLISDCNRAHKLRVVWAACSMFLLLLKVRPDVVVSTGAAPGYLAVRMARWFGAKTIWVDSIANVEELSMSGKMAGSFVTVWLTQWPHLQTPEGPACYGGVL